MYLSLVGNVIYCCSPGWNSGDQPRALPFIRVLVEPDLGSTQVIHYRSLEATIQEVHIRVDLDHIMYMVAYLGRLLSLDPAKENNNTDTSRKFSVLSQTDERGRSVLEAKLQTHLEVPDRVKGTSVMYLELLHHSSVILHIDMTMGQQRKGLELGEDEALATGLELLGSGFGQYVSDIARSFASFHPTFVFNELLLTHFFGSPSVLARTILLSMRQQALTQSYKVVGSLDILGNPISLVNRMGNGVMEVRSCWRLWGVVYRPESAVCHRLIDLFYMGPFVVMGSSSARRRRRWWVIRTAKGKA